MFSDRLLGGSSFGGRRGAWYWYNNNVQAHSTKQIAETAAREGRETAECHMEAFKMRPESTEAALEIQAEFIDLCMAVRESLCSVFVQCVSLHQQAFAPSVPENWPMIVDRARSKRCVVHTT